MYLAEMERVVFPLLAVLLEVKKCLPNVFKVGYSASKGMEAVLGYAGLPVNVALQLLCNFFYCKASTSVLH